MSMKVPMKGYSRVSISISWHKYLIKMYRSCSTIKTTGNQWELTFDMILWGSVCPHKNLPWNDLSPFCFTWWFVLLSPWKIFRARHSWRFNTGSAWLQCCRGRLERCWEVKMESWRLWRVPGTTTFCLFVTCSLLRWMEWNLFLKSWLGWRQFL